MMFNHVLLELILHVNEWTCLSEDFMPDTAGIFTLLQRCLRCFKHVFMNHLHVFKIFGYP